MDSTRSFQYFNLPVEKPELSPSKKSLYRTLYATLAFMPIMLGFNFVGFLLVYLLALGGFLDTPDARLLMVGGVSLLIGVLHLPLFGYFRREKYEQVAAIIVTLNVIGGAAQIFFWYGITWFVITLAVVPCITLILHRGVGVRYRVYALLLGIIAAVAVSNLDNHLGTSRLQLNSLTPMAGLTIYITIFVALIVLIVITANVSFQTIASRLIATFAFIAIISAVSTLFISTLTSFFHDQQTTFKELQSVTTLKQTQINDILTNLNRETTAIMSDPAIRAHADFLFNNQPDVASYQDNYSALHSYFLQLQAQDSTYSEIMLLDKNGKVVLSTTDQDEDKNFSTQSFFQRARANQSFTVEPTFPGASDTSLLASQTFYQNGTFEGVLAVRTGFDAIRQVIAAKTGLGISPDTYLVGTDYFPLTEIAAGNREVKTFATEQAIVSHVQNGQGTYRNYDNTTVLGTYTWIAPLQVTLVSEINQGEVLRNTISLLFVNSFVGLFTLLMSFMLVFVAARSVSEPITELSAKATALTNGLLGTRFEMERQDEIGALASKFNAMASEIQGSVRNLEQRITERTADLQKQTTRLRVIAEVAHNATSSHETDELLNQSANLILERFGFDHVGVFMLDEQQEYVVLVASPTEAGRQMLKKKQRFKLGQTGGIVGYAAASGKVRVTLDTNTDAIYLYNPLLPDTHSEIAIPLKVNEITFGVLDIQSQEPEAFTGEDIASLQILADQLALAIQYARQTAALEKNRLQTEQLYQQFTMSSWKIFQNQEDTSTGYHFDGMHIVSLESYSPESRDALENGKTVIVQRENDDGEVIPIVAVPLKLRGQVIGAINVRFSSNAISKETVGLIEDIANRLAVALENARLYTETQRLAERERTIGNVANRITSSINVESILRTTVEEIGKMLPNAEVVVQLKQEKEE